MELLQREIFKIQNSSEKEKLHLEAENREISAKLKTFENLEKELDSVVLHIADDDNENDPEQMLRNFGIGGNMPTNSRRRMQQSVRLAKRALNLERINVDKSRELDLLKESNTKLKEQVQSLEAAMDGVNQPYSYLVQSAADKDSTIAGLKEKLKKQHRYLFSSYRVVLMILSQPHFGTHRSRGQTQTCQETVDQRPRARFVESW